MAKRALRSARGEDVLTSLGVVCATSRRVLRSLGLAVALVALTPPARAGDVDKARALFADGVAMLDRGDFEGARRAFLAADQEHHAPAIVYNLGLAEERLGHPQAAVDAYEAYVAEAGAGGELTEAATLAIAQIKARSTRLRVETTPPGLRLFVDGAPLRETSPTTLLVTRGRHVVVAQSPSWRAELDVEAKGENDAMTVTLAPPGTDHAEGGLGPSAIAPPPRGPAPPIAPPEAPATREPDGFVYGASFAVAPYYLLGTKTAGASNERAAGPSVVAGFLVDVGVALTNRVELLFHGYAALGPDGKPTYTYWGGPSLSVRVLDPLWVGATFIGGRLETLVRGVPYGTDLVFGASVHAALEVLRKPYGQWFAWAEPGFLLTELRNDNTALFVPLGFGFRSF